jgi:ABC-type Fe3+/spermidine/putrescine transport system ATPase subunit
VVRPQVLLLDEPLANLDANLRITMRHLIRSIQSEMGITAIFVTHDQEEAVMLADRVALMFDGVLQQVGSPDVFYRSPRSTRVAQFFRNGNFLSGVRRGSAVHTGAGEISVDPTRVPDGDGPVVLTVRPEEIELTSADSRLDNVVSGTVTSLIYMGAHTQLVVDIAGSAWHVQGPATLQVAEGDLIHLRLPPQHIWLVDDDGAPVASESSVAV